MTISSFSLRGEAVSVGVGTPRSSFSLNSSCRGSGCRSGNTADGCDFFAREGPLGCARPGSVVIRKTHSSAKCRRTCQWNQLESNQNLPVVWQSKCLQFLLIQRHHYVDPICYTRTFAAGYQGMPCPASFIPDSIATPRGMGRPVAVQHLGKCSSFEVNALPLSTDRLLEDGHQVHFVFA